MIKQSISKLRDKVNIVSISLFGGCLIAVCVLVLSYAHTTALFERSGYRSILAHIGVIGFEAAFILGTVTLIWAKLNGEKVRFSTRCVFGLGIAFNLYSNISSGVAKNGQPIVFYVWKGIVIDEAVLVGALIPLLIEAAVLVISDAIVQYRKLRQTVKQSNTQTTKQSNNQTVEQSTDKQQTIKQTDNQTSKQQTAAIKQTPERPVKQSNKHQTEIEQPNSQSDKQQKAVKQPNSQSDKQQGEEPTNEEIEEIALRLKKELGDWPSYRKLAEEANTNPYQAGKAIKRLKARAS